MINVVYACNDAYVRQTIVSMISVLKHNQEVKFYLIQDGVSEAHQVEIRNRIMLYQTELHIVNIVEVLPKALYLSEKDRHPRTIYAKLFLNHIVMEDRVLYLDSDVLVEGSLKPLFARNMERELAAGVLMPYSVKLKKRVNAPLGQPYICDGVVLVNMELWREEHKADECMAYIDSNAGKPPMLSEGVLNHVCEGRMGVLEPKYNLMPSMIMYSLKQLQQLFSADYYYQDEEMMETARTKPVGIHFMNELYNRPWCEPCDHPYKKAYHMLETEIFGEREYKKQDLAFHTRMTKKLVRYLPFSVFRTLYQIKNG